MHRSKFSKLKSRDWSHQKQPSTCDSFGMWRLTSAKLISEDEGHAASESYIDSSSDDEGPHVSKSHRDIFLCL
ncbi:hypothetical protein AOLI_G00106780 [Acnodon oligacanthus]